MVEVARRVARGEPTVPGRAGQSRGTENGGGRGPRGRHDAPPRPSGRWSAYVMRSVRGVDLRPPAPACPNEATRVGRGCCMARRRLPAKSPTASDAAPRRPPPAPGPDQQRRDEANGPPSPAMSSLTARHDSTQIRSCEGREALSGGSPVRDRGSATPLARASRRHPRSQLVERSGARAFIPVSTPVRPLIPPARISSRSRDHDHRVSVGPLVPTQPCA